MFDAVMGGPGEFRKRPFVVANNTFVVPPLRYAEESAECMVAQVQAGMPINLLSAGQAGATSPAALAGSLVQALAECLAALTNVNLMSPGHPCVMGLWPFVSDLRTGAMTGGSGEEGAAQRGGGPGGELARPALRRCGGHGRLEAARQPGRLREGRDGHPGRPRRREPHLRVGRACSASLLGCSLEALVIDNDMMGSINRTIRGIDIDADEHCRPT